MLEFYGLDTLTPTEWVERQVEGGMATMATMVTMRTMTAMNIQLNKSAFKGEASAEQLLSSLASLDSARQLLRDDCDPLDLKDPSFVRQVLLARAPPTTTEESQSHLEIPINSIVITQANFDPRGFLKEVHFETSFNDLLRGRQNLERASLQRNESLKNLVKQNFDRFVNAKNSTEAVFKDMQQRRLTEQDHGMRKAIEAVSVAFQRAQDVYGALMERREREVRLCKKLELFNQYSFIFSLGYRLEQAMKVGEYQTAVFDYRKAKTMMQDAVNGTLKNLLQKTWAGHVDQTLGALRSELNSKLANSVFNYEVHSKLIDFLIDLDSHPDPVTTFFNLRKNDILNQCKTALNRNIEEIKCVSADIDSAAVPRILLAMVQRRQAHRVGMLQVDIVRCWKIRASFFYTISDLYSKFYADFGKFINGLLNGRFCRDKARRQQDISINEERIYEFANDFANLFPALIGQILDATLVTKGGIQESSIVAMHYSGKAASQLCEMHILTVDAKAPLSIVEATRKIVENAVHSFLNTIWDAADGDCALLPNFETWQSSGEGFDLSTVLVKGFETLLVTLIDGSASLVKSFNEAINGTASGTISKTTSKANNLSNLDTRLTGSICAFLQSVAKLALDSKEVSNPDQIVAAVDDQKDIVRLQDLSVSYKLLTVMTNMLYLRQVAIPHIFETFSLSGALGTISDSAKQSAIAALDSIEDKVKQKYLDEKRGRLLSLIQMGTINSGFDWLEERPPGSIRQYLHTILLELVSIQTQIYDVSSAILRPLMSNLVLDILQEFLRCIKLIREFGPGGYLQLRSEVALIQNKLITVMDQEALDLYAGINGALESACQALPKAEETRKIIDQLVRDTDKSTSMSFSCFQYT